MFLTPLLAIRAASLGADVLQTVARNVSGSPAMPEARGTTAPAPAQFSEMLASVAASPKVQQARFLRAEGIQDRSDAEIRLGELVRQITAESPEARAATAGSSSPFEMRVLSNGDLSLRMAGGRIRTVHLAGETRNLALKARQILDALGTSADSASPIDHSMIRWSAQGALHVTPGGGVSIQG